MEDLDCPSPSRRQSSRLRSPRAFPGGVEAWWRSGHPMNARGKDFGDIRDKEPPQPSGNKNLPGVNLQMMDGERPQKFRIGEIDRPGVLRKKFERFEQGPVLDVMAELRTVVNSVEGVPEHEARCALSERSGSGPLEHGSVEFGDAQFQTIGCQVPA